MLNLAKEKNPMPEQDPMVRNKNFKEVSTGYTEDMAVNEAMRCLQCRKKPCTTGCPVRVRIPEFIAKIAEGEFEEAYQIISTTSSLPAICGRVCPQENQCEGRCSQGTKGEPVAIGRLERFAADWHREHGTDESVERAEGNGHKVAVVGSGPAGLACAGDLIAKGYDVTVFESLHKEGGVLAYGIPEFRLPKAIVSAEVSALQEKGVEFVNNAVIGMSMTVDELFEDGYEAVFVGTGAGLPQFMNIPGENLLGVYSANEYLTRINLMKAYKPEYDTPIQIAKRVAVIGGGNVAMDAARCAKRMGAEEVYIVYRRSMDEIPARKEEIHHAIEEGIIFRLLTNPVAIKGTEEAYVCGLECVEMELGEPDASGRRRPVEKKGSNFILDVDAVIMAIGTRLNKLILETTEDLEPNKKGGIGADEKTGATSHKGIFAGGDAVTGAATVILAMGAGKNAADSIDQYLEAN
ncbi:NADPH-dependent glutamate synthase [Aminipila luticellarii]|uniref:NADPH-dependent glutamate synthase n=1 Tax=Aminipila luticellarii TaxID=2507160 RepID=A0A410PT80_9FIRM|nr:NADPH-dependent glutamate synthase [Aminipila luticellarii]QAT42096.1 NADPH-dependent glutamate synthase [Aminipila luticellarii]